MPAGDAAQCSLTDIQAEQIATVSNWFSAAGIPTLSRPAFALLAILALTPASRPG